MQSPWTSSSCLAWKSCISAGDEVYLCADVTDIAEGATATIKIVEEDADGTDDPLTTLSVVVSGGRIKCRWKVQYTADEDDANSQQELAEKGYTLPEYAFVVECGGATSGESGVLEVRGWIKTQFKDEKTGKPISNHKYTIYLSDGSTKTGAVLRNTRISLIKNDTVYKTVCTDSNGYFELLDIPIGIFEIKQENP